ncbi:MAG: PIN domain-containing protein [Candidatus Aenigmarchaeota archaeon]|nr:PIN domain-containing protein [Candidatus Aenigmarchaeota archaeon]
MKVVLDTNFLIDAMRFKIDLDEIRHIAPEPCLLFTLTSVVKELERISRRKTRPSLYARAALKVQEAHGIRVINSSIQTDKALLNLSKSYAIATNDRQLRKAIKALGGKTIYLKSKKHLAIG